MQRGQRQQIQQTQQVQQQARTGRVSAQRCRPIVIGTAWAILSTAGAWADNPLEEIVISSSRVGTPLREVGTSVSVMLEDEILQRGFLTLPDLLRTQPSVAASNNGGSGKATSVRIRGEEGFRTMVLIDGMDIADPSTPQVSPRLEQLLTSGIERIEILRGPQGLMYGADAGGVITLRSATPRDGLGGNVAVETGSFGTEQLTARVGGDFDKVDFLISAADFSTDGFNSRDTDIAPADDDGYDNRTLHARAGWSINESLRLEAVARSVEGGNAYDSCFTASFTPSDDCNDDFQQDSWRLGATLERGSWQQEISYSDSRVDREFFAEGSAFFRALGGIRRASYLGSYKHSDALTLVYGIDSERESIDDGSVDRARDQTGAYAEYQGRFANSLTVTAGLRHDDNEDFGDYTSYRISGAWVRSLGEGELKLKSAYGTGFRAPSLFEISYNRGPFALPPASDTRLVEESSAGYDLGLAWASATGIYFEATWFDQQVDDLITFDPTGFSGYLQASGRSDSRGVELIANMPLTSHVALTSNYTWNRTETPDGEQRAFRPEQLLNIGLSYAGFNERLRLGANLRGSADAVDTEGASVDDYLLVDINASYVFPAGLTVYGRLENALDEDYQEIPSYNTAGQAAYAGIRYEF
jgi:vitamin B12 transporter